LLFGEENGETGVSPPAADEISEIEVSSLAAGGYRSKPEARARAGI
jgi:hypothetical protein